jgi:tetrahydromethanopterin S-methyltransferase subunit B
MDLQLDDDERTLLSDVVGDAIQSLREEIYHTDTFEIREQLKRREAMLDGLQRKLGAATTSS